MNTNDVNSIPTSESSNWGIIISLMVLGCIIGTIALWCYQRTLPADEKTIGKKNEDKLEILKILGMGMGAVALVPVFLQMISSSLLKEAESNMESRFIFLGFCVAATVIARRFLSVVPEKLLNTLANTKKTAEEAKVLASSAGGAANRNAAAHEPPSEVIKQVVQSGPIAAYDWKALRIIRAFLNPNFSKSRTTTGLAFDSGISSDETLKYLEQMVKNGDACRFPGDSTKGSWWALTAEGRKKFTSLKTQLDQLNIVDTDVV